jgi:D-hydroxyproline dehydrogenase subunit alpha
MTEAKDFEVLVVGAGPAGLAAAVAAAEAGQRVAVIDDNAAPGGQIWRRDLQARPLPAQKAEWLERVASCGARIKQFSRHTVVDGQVLESGGVALALHNLAAPEARLVKLVAPNVVLACGARERFLPFPGWTAPGLFGVGGLQALVKQGLEVADRRLVLAGSGPLLLAVAADLRARGARILAIVEQASRFSAWRVGLAALAQGSKRRQALGLVLELKGIRQIFGAWPTATEVDGDGRLAALVVSNGSKTWRFECDFAGVGFGLIPELRLARHLGCVLAGAAVEVDAEQRTSLPRIFAVGEQCGIGGVEVALLEGTIAGRAAAGQALDSKLARAREVERRFAARVEQAFALRPELKTLAQPETVICRCEDIPLAALRPFSDARSAKLQTRCAMGSCQGRVCEPALEFLLGWAPARPRPPLFPLPLAALVDQPQPQLGCVSPEMSP